MAYQKPDEDELFNEESPVPPKESKVVWITKKKKNPVEEVKEPEPQEEDAMFLNIDEPDEDQEEPDEVPPEEESMFLNDEELKKKHEELLKHVEEIEIARKTLPRKVDFKRILLFIYICLNLGFLYVSLNSKALGYIALYMIPLTVILVDYSLMLGRLDRTVREKLK